MTSNDKWALPLATKLIKKSGKLVTYRRIIESGEYDPITDTQLSIPMDNPIKALIQKPDIKLIDNNLIKSTTLILMIDSQSIPFLFDENNNIKIDLKDTIIINNVAHSISLLNPEYSGEKVAYCDFVANIK